MLSIICNQISQRLRYVCEIVFSQFLNVPYQLIPYAQYNSSTNDYVIDYGDLSSLSQSKFTIPNTGLTFEQGIKKRDIKFHQADLPYLFHKHSTSENILDFDIFSAIFYLVSEYEKYSVQHLDSHGRYIRNEYPTHSLQLDKLPLVHLYIENLRKALQKKWPALKFSKKIKFDYEITIDVDMPWKYLNKGGTIFIGGGIKQIFAGDFRGLKERIKTLYTGTDPNFTFHQLYDLCPPDKTTFFFLINRNSQHDGRFTLESKPYKKLIAEIQQKGYSIGIHPSYHSFLDPNMIASEKKALEEFLDTSIDKSRQHFLKYRLPNTFQYLEAAGIRHEYSICDFQQGGFPTGMAQPYKWYDLEEERISDLWIHPTIIMDWSLLHYMNLTSEKALEQIQIFTETCKKYDGIFNILIHNDCLSDSKPWSDWRETMIEIVNSLTANS